MSLAEVFCWPELKIHGGRTLAGAANNVSALQFDWWIVLLNLVAFCLVGAYTVMGPHRSNIGVVALLAVVTTLNMIRCDGEG